MRRRASLDNLTAEQRLRVGEVMGGPGVAFLLAALAAAPAPAGQAGEPEGGQEFKVYVVTAGPGDRVWERFGHTLLWIRDPVRGTERVWNYGLFSFQQENFLLRFARGIMLYWMGGADVEATFREYRAANRSLWAQELALTPRQSADLLSFLEWNERPENRSYRYNYFRDNCTTRVRDALDRVLGGQLAAWAQARGTDDTYRDLTLRLAAADPLLYTALHLLLGPSADRPLTAWDAMSMPAQLQRYLAELSIPDSAGRPTPLVRSEVTLFQARRARPPEDTPRAIPLFLALGVALGLFFALSGSIAPRSRAARIAFTAVALPWLSAVALAGLALAGLWALTEHVDAYRNLNVLHADPIALALVVLVPALVRRKQWARRPALWLAGAVAALSVVGAAIEVFPAIGQVNGEFVGLFLPAHLGLAWAVHRLAAAAIL